MEILEARTDKPITRLRTTVTRGDGTIALDGTAVCYTTAIPAAHPPRPSLACGDGDLGLVRSTVHHDTYGGRIR